MTISIASFHCILSEMIDIERRWGQHRTYNRSNIYENFDHISPFMPTRGLFDSKDFKCGTCCLLLGGHLKGMTWRLFHTHTHPPTHPPTHTHTHTHKSIFSPKAQFLNFNKPKITVINTLCRTIRTSFQCLIVCLPVS